MKKMKWAMLIAAAAVMFAGKGNTAYALDLAVGRGDFENNYFEDGEYVNDDYVDIPAGTPIAEVINNGEPWAGTVGMWISAKWSSLSEEQKLQYLVSTATPDNDALTWWVNMPYDDAIKFQYLNGVTKTGTESSTWLINSSIPMEQKVAYFRTHEIRFNSSQVFQWWWENVGSLLTMADTTVIDSHNYEFYRKAMTHKLDSVEIVEYGKEWYYIAAEELEKGLANGSIYGIPNYYVNGSTEYFLKVAPKDSGCMLWRVR